MCGLSLGLLLLLLVHILKVTDENKDEYLSLNLRHRMLDSVKPQLEALLQGMYEVGALVSS